MGMGLCSQGTEGNFAVIHHGIRGYVGDVYQSGWSFNVPTQDLVDAFPAGDKRKDASVLDIVKWADDTGAEYGEGYEHTGILITSIFLDKVSLQHSKNWILELIIEP